MRGGGFALAGVLAVALLAVGCSGAIDSARGGSGASAAGLTRPDRPRVFHTPEELRHYLDAVSNYYAVASRPGRFGKRSSPRLSRVQGPLQQQLQQQREERVAMQRRDVLDGLVNDQGLGLGDGLDTMDAVPDYLFQFAPGPAPSPASEVYPLYLEQEHLSQARSSQE